MKLLSTGKSKETLEAFNMNVKKDLTAVKGAQLQPAKLVMPGFRGDFEGKLSLDAV